MLRPVIVLLAATAATSLATPVANGGPKCQLHSIDIAATAQNLDIPTDIDLSSLTPDALAKLASTLPKKQVSGRYNIVGSYCEPENLMPSRKNTLQILVHGISYTKTYWSGLGLPGQSFNGSFYSWVDYASKQGYPTFSIDRICNGQSEHPNGITACQLPLNAAIVNGIIEAARSGSLWPGHTFSKIIMAGHSYGSLLLNLLAQEYPEAVDSYILTGFTNNVMEGAGHDFTEGHFVPAALGDPRYKNTSDPSYLVGTSESGLTGLFYYGAYSPQVPAFDYKNRGTLTIGEFASAALGQLPAQRFTKSILVLNGQEDVIFCPKISTNPLNGPFVGDCGKGASSSSASTRNLYPSARVYRWQQFDQTGHDANLHYAGQNLFKAAHEFLASQGF